MQLVKTCPTTGKRIARPLPLEYKQRVMEKCGRGLNIKIQPGERIARVVSNRRKNKVYFVEYPPWNRCELAPGHYIHILSPEERAKQEEEERKRAQERMSKRTIDLSVLSTPEIQQIRNEQIAKKKAKTSKDKLDLEELKPMTVNAMRDFILNSTSTTDMLIKHMRIQSFQKADDEDLVLFELHGYAKFNERTMMRNLLDRTIGRIGVGFMKKLVKYVAEFCINQYRLQHCRPWFNLLQLRTDYDWPAVFVQCTVVFPELELPLLVTMITLIPDQQPKHIARIYSLMAANEDIPNCFVWLSKIMVKNYGTSPPDKKDMEICTRRYLNKVYNYVKPKLGKSTTANPLPEAQRKFAEISEELFTAALKIIDEKNMETMKTLISDPRCNIEETPCPLFIEYFIQFVKLGVFNFSNADKLIAWNYYYDDRWMGYDRPDLFGTDFELYDQFIYTESFKRRKNLNMEHPHMVELTLATRAYDWMTKDKELFKSLMEKYADEDLIQYFAISLTFCGFFDHMIELFENYKDKMKTNEGFMCLHMGYLFACIKKPGMVKEAMVTWATIVKHAIQWKYLACIAFNPKTFPIPAFVRVKFAGQFATRMMRNCLWEAAKAEGVNGWKKYGLLILLFCESLEDSFLNHQMVRVLFQKIEVENWTFVLRPGFERCIRRGDTFNHIMTNVYIENEEMLDELRKQNFLPPMKDFPKEVPTPAYLRIFQMLKEKDDVFAEMQDWIPEEILVDEVVEPVPEGPAEKTGKKASEEKRSSTSSELSAPTDTPDSPAPTKDEEMSNDVSLMESEDGMPRRMSLPMEAGEAKQADLPMDPEEPKQADLPMETEEEKQADLPMEAEEAKQADVSVKAEEPKQADLSMNAGEAEQADSPMETEEVKQADVSVEAKESKQADLPVEAEEPTQADLPMDTEEPKQDDVSVDAEEEKQADLPMEAEEPEQADLPMNVEEAQQAEIDMQEANPEMEIQELGRQEVEPQEEPQEVLDLQEVEEQNQQEMPQGVEAIELQEAAPEPVEHHELGEPEPSVRDQQPEPENVELQAAEQPVEPEHVELFEVQEEPAAEQAEPEGVELQEDVVEGAEPQREMLEVVQEEPVQHAEPEGIELQEEAIEEPVQQELDAQEIGEVEPQELHELVQEENQENVELEELNGSDEEPPVLEQEAAFE